MQKGLMRVIAPLVADPEATVPIEPGKRALDHPSIAAKALARLDSSPRDTGNDTPCSECLATASKVVALVRVQLGRTLATPAMRRTNGLDRIDGLFQHLGVVHIGRRLGYCERNALPVDHNMALRARFAAIRRVRTGFGSPPGAGTLAESSEARVQSIRSASPRRSNSAWWILCHTPAFCHSCRRRQQVIPLPHPISLGSISQGMPERSTKMMPVRTLRSGMRGRPPFGLGGSGGSTGSMIFHSPSESRGFAMAPIIPHYVGFC